MNRRTVTLVTRTQGNNAKVTSGSIAPESVDLELVDVPVLVQGFRRMVRELEFDVCEMALTTYLCAREHGVPFTALPVFLARGFHHGAILVREDSELQGPRQLEGHAVGVHRGYTVTTGVWARAIMRLEHRLALDRVTWVLSGDEHVAAYQPPANVAHLPDGEDLTDLVLSGELPAAVNIKPTEGLRPLITDPESAARNALATRGFYPINHLLVVRDDVLAEQPQLAADLTATFTRAKDAYLVELFADDGQWTGADDDRYRTIHAITGADPLPYGLEPNRAMLELLIEQAVEQGILRRVPDLESLFATTEDA